MIADAGLDSIAAVRRDDIEDYKVWLTIQPRAAGQVITAETRRQRIRAVRVFFERIIEWDWPHDRRRCWADSSSTLSDVLRRFIP